MSNKPFIIKPKGLGQPLIEPTSTVYNETQQHRVQIVQAANGYLAINMLYESVKLLWSFFHFRQQCDDYAYLSLGFMGLNILWAITSFWGFKSINSRSSRNITIFVYTVVLNLLLRIIMYTVCGVIMKGYVKGYEIDPEQKNNLLCNAIYPSSLFIMQGCLEAIVCLLILVLSKGIAAYVQQWQNNETSKFIPKNFHNLEDY